MKKIILLAILLTVFHGFSSAQTDKRWADVKAGNYSVGFKTLLKYDRSRMNKEKTDIEGKPLQGNRFRPVEISIWYPAVKGGTPMKFEDYLYVRQNFQGEIENKILSNNEKQSIIRNFKESRLRAGANEKALDDFLKADLPVLYDAPFAEGKFPVIIMPSGAYQLDNAALCEFLASHGYIAVHTPWQRPTIGYVDDLEFAVNYLAENKSADTSRMGAVGFSYGGLIASIFQLKNRSLNALVSLDGVDAWKWGVDEILASPYYAVRKADVPYLRFHNAKQDEQTTAPTAKVDWRFYQTSKYADIIQIDFDKVTHLDFLSGSLTRAFIPNFSPNSPVPDAGLPIFQKLIQTYTLNFLNAHVKNETSGREFLQKTLEQNGFPKEIAVLKVKKGVIAPPTSAQIYDTLLQPNGIFIVKRVLDEARKRSEPLTDIFTENQMNTWGYFLLNQNRTTEAVAAMEISAEVYPQSANAFDSLAEALEKNGQLKQSAESYEKAYKIAAAKGDTRLAQTAKANFERVSAKLK